MTERRTVKLWRRFGYAERVRKAEAVIAWHDAQWVAQSHTEAWVRLSQS